MFETSAYLIAAILNGTGALIIIVENEYLGVCFAFPLCFLIVVGTLCNYRI